MQPQKSKKYGSLNHESELSGKNILMTYDITPDVIDCIKNRIVSAFNPKKIIIFGSYANGTEHKYSDLDLLVITDNPDPNRKLRMQINSLLFPRLFPLDIIVNTDEEINRLVETENEFYLDINENYKIIYEKEI